MNIEDNTNCTECGNAFELHSLDRRCPKNGGYQINGKLEFFTTHFESEFSEIDQLRARIDELETHAENANIAAKSLQIQNVKLIRELAHLTAGSEAMQEDARNNTATIKMLMAQLAEQVEENRGLRQMLHMEPK